jgi:hypothetical protein
MMEQFAPWKTVKPFYSQKINYDEIALRKILLLGKIWV